MTPVPVGFKFLPTDEEIFHYLFNKAKGLHVNTLGNIIDDCDIYGDEKTWMNLFLATNKEQLFFFSKLRKKFDNGKRIDRSSLNGTWKESNSKIIRSGNKIIGTKHFFNFIPNKGFCVKERLLMNEYRIAGDMIKRVKDASLVVCRIARKKPLRSSIRFQEQTLEPLRMLQTVQPTFSLQYDYQSFGSTTLRQIATIGVQDQTLEPLSLQNNDEGFGPAMLLQTATTEPATIEVQEQNLEPLRMLQFVPPTFSLQNNDEGFGPATLLQTTTTEKARQVEALIDDPARDDFLNEFSISLEELGELLSSP